MLDSFALLYLLGHECGLRAKLLLLQLGWTVDVVCLAEGTARALCYLVVELSVC